MEGLTTYQFLSGIVAIVLIAFSAVSWYRMLFVKKPESKETK